MQMISAAILALAGVILIAGGHIAHELHQNHVRTGYHSYETTVVIGFAVAIAGLVLLGVALRSRFQANRLRQQGTEPQSAPGDNPLESSGSIG